MFSVLTVCPSSECVLCIPHYLTLTLFILPIFAPNHSNSTPNIYAIPVDEYSGSYLERVSNFVNEIVSELRGTLQKHDELSCVENDSNRSSISIKLFLNEIEQLQSQLLNILNFDSQSKVCCGFLKTWFALEIYLQVDKRWSVISYASRAAQNRWTITYKLLKPNQKIMLFLSSLF